MNKTEQLAYDLIDRFLRAALDDEDYATYNLALEVVLAAHPLDTLEYKNEN